MLILVAVALASWAVAGDAALSVVDPAHVCMVNDAVFEKEQIRIEVEGKAYYGCCNMCKERLAQDEKARTAVDPVSGNKVDKAEAVIGADAEGRVYYFENEKNLKGFKPPAGK
jgi:YHS domain-containing protein